MQRWRGGRWIVGCLGICLAASCAPAQELTAPDLPNLGRLESSRRAPSLLPQGSESDEAEELPAPGGDQPLAGPFGDFLRPLGEVQVGIRPSGEQLPPDFSKDLFRSAQNARTTRGWPRMAKSWQASELVHQPVYFDDVILERYGQSFSPELQPFLSGAHFFGTFPIVPYKMGIDRTHDLISVLGYYRPGSPTPLVGRRLPWETDAALFETGAWLGLIFIFP